MHNKPAAELYMYREGGAIPKDFRSSFHWRIFRIMAEFVEGWQFLADYRKTVTFFGSTRFNPNNHWYKEARKLGEMLACKGFNVITGGGPGIMEAGNRGAHEARVKNKSKGIEIGDSVGLNIRLPHEQRTNRYVRSFVAFHYFFVRKVMLSYHAQAYVYFPGGFGTLDETFELLTLIQTCKIAPVPIVMVGKKFWTPLVSWMEKMMLEQYHTIGNKDLSLFTVVDTAAQAYKIIQQENGKHYPVE